MLLFIKKVIFKPRTEGDFLDQIQGIYEHPQLTSYLIVKDEISPPLHPAKIRNKATLFWRFYQGKYAIK